MYISILFFIIIIFFPYFVYLCNYNLLETSGTIIFLSYSNNIECTWTFNLSTKNYFRHLLLTFRHFDTEYGHDELSIGETISDVSKYNSKLFRFSGSKLPNPCLIPLRGDILTRSIWIQFISDETTTGSGFIIDYIFLVNQSTTAILKSQELLIDAEIRHPLEYKSQNSHLTYTYPYGTISSPNYPKNYSNNIICRWHLYHRNAFIRLYINNFHTELHYDTLTLHLGQNLNNRAMILYEWSGYDIDNRNLFIRNDNLFLIFNTDNSYNASGFSLKYEVIEKEIYTWNIYEDNGIIHSKYYPKFLRTNIEYTWIIHMNSSNEIKINLIDINLDYDYDYLQIITDTIYPLNIPKSFRLQTINETKLILRTKHSNDDYQYRGFNLTYQKLNQTSIKEKNQLENLPCGKIYSSFNGTIEFHYEIFTSFNCLILIEVDDGQNIFLRFDYLNWDNKENYIDIGLFHDPNQYQIYHISDTLPGTWFITNHSQLWIRFHSSQFSLGISTFRLFYSETIQWSTISSEPYTQILDDNKLFPYRLISLPTNSIYHNLTQAYIWHIKALDDECIKIIFQSFEVVEDRRLCFYVKDLFKTIQICNNEEFPFVYHHIGSCIISIEPEFSWILVKYNIQIEKFKKITKINKITFKNDHMVLLPSIRMHPFIHIEWLVSMDNSSIIIFDIENFDRDTTAELIIRQDENITKIYLLEKISLNRFSHILFTLKSSFQIIYKSLLLSIDNQKRLFRINLHKISKTYFYFGDFHYISWKQNQSHSIWTIDGQYKNSTFLANLFSSNENLLLETTADVNLSMNNSLIYIPSSNFDIRYKSQNESINSDFILILYEQKENKSNQNIIINKTSDIIQTNNYAYYNIDIQLKIFDLIDFIIINADNGTLIRLYDLNVNHSGYFLLNSSLIITKGITSLIGLRFSIRSLKIKIELQSLTKNSIKLRYNIRTSSIQNKNLHHCFIIDTNLHKNNKSQTYNESCSNWFDHISTPMNNTRITHLWPYAFRGSVTLIIENTTIENFEQTIYRNLRQSIAKIIRNFCLKYQEHCLSEDIDSIRTDHVIIQSYEEQLDNHHLYVSIFIKDPYRQTVALTNDQFLLALKYNQQEIYQDIKHHINLPSNVLEQNPLDSIWLYGVCLLALIVLIVVVLMLITIFMRRTSQSTKKINKNKLTKNISTKKDDSFLISYPIQQLTNEYDENNLSLCNNNETLSSQKSNANFIENISPPTSFYHYPTNHASYFNSTIETAMKERLDDDDEPIPFIDDNLSVTHSRKSSVCWSDKTSLSGRLNLTWKLNRLRSTSQNRSTLSNEKEKRRYHHRTVRYAQSSSQEN
ncbi:unnamed protein product [Rotaria sordida]|uniref:CUB domain-containing protein n=1 Tax=Rotaria sordida TaxID=392033 RepID=A0A814J5P6_9BILA|nr:unnamed protein product [Rotaria sordida]CAF1451680.1 unnamed protein product [Rotaria sordida]